MLNNQKRRANLILHLDALSAKYYSLTLKDMGENVFSV